MKAKEATLKKEKKTLSLKADSKRDGMFIGTKSDGSTYSVRKDRHRYFFPNEWLQFKKTLKPNQEILFDLLFHTGARIEEALHVRLCDLDIDRWTLKLVVTKSKAKKGESAQMGGAVRNFRVSSTYLKRLKKYAYASDIKTWDERIFKVTKQSVWQLFRRKMIESGIKDYWNFSLHNIRKTHGMWLKTLQSRGKDLDISEICMRLGHDHNTFIKHYGSPSVFGDADRDKMLELMGDIYGFK